VAVHCHHQPRQQTVSRPCLILQQVFQFFSHQAVDQLFVVGLLIVVFASLVFCHFSVAWVLYSVDGFFHLLIG